MRLLVITNQFPLPLDMGGPVRILGLMRVLAASHEVYVLARRRPDTSDELVADLARTLRAPVETFLPGGPRRRGRLAGMWRWLRALQRGMPPWVLAQFDPALARRARELAPGCSVVVLLDDYAGAYARRIHGLAPIVADKHNVAGWSASPPASTGGGFACALRAKARHRLSLRLTRRFERRCAREVDALVVTSEEERARFQALYGRLSEAVIPSAVTPGPARSPRPRPRPCLVGWLGSHGYSANVEGLMRFVGEAWVPLGEAGFHLLIAGGNPTHAVRSLERYTGVQVLGYVERLGDLLEQLDAAVVPLWRGAGVKIKTLTLMGSGVPVVGTAVAFEGLDAEHGTHCLIGEDPEELAVGLRAIGDDRELARRLAVSGRQLVIERFTWESVGPRFVEAVEQAALRSR